MSDSRFDLHSHLPQVTPGKQTGNDQLAAFVPAHLRRDEFGKPVVPHDAASMYGFGSLLRETEQLLLELFAQGVISGTTHTCVGQELCQMSVVRALSDPNDAVVSNHRNHGHFLTYSGDFQGLIAEVMGRESGVCGGVGGSQHLAYRHFHSNGVQAGMTAIAVGLAQARKMRAESGIVVSIVGDGTLGEGLFYESLNLASIWHLPLLFVVENNGIAQTTPTAQTIGGTIDGRGAAFGIRTWRLDDADSDFMKNVEQVVEVVRSSGEPGFLTIDTRRMGPHSKGDDTRDDSELDIIKKRDPLSRLQRELPEAECERIDEENRRFLKSIYDAVLDSPPAKYEVAPKSIFTIGRPLLSGSFSDREVHGNVRADLNSALRSMLADSPQTVLLGEDIHDPYGGAFKVTAGLSSSFPSRVLSTPISEAGITGAGIGLALAGFRPVVEIMFADFLMLTMDQVFNHAVKFPGMFPDVQVPLVIRTPSGGRRGYGPTHSQSPESLMAAVPGLTVVFPSQRHAVGRLLRHAVLEWPYPTVFFEHKLLYSASVDSHGYSVVPASEADPAADLFPTLVRGSDQPDLTIIAYGGMVSVAETVAEALRAEELEAEIVIPSLLSPLPRRTLSGLLATRKRIVVMEECTLQSGFGAELAATLLESGYRGSFQRVGAAPVPIPAARSLEADVIPAERELMTAILTLLHTETNTIHAETNTHTTHQ